jgi:transcriptional regulator with XRE-family HTH domain
VIDTTPNYGRAIAIVRAARGYALWELAERAGISASQLSLAERGLRNLGTPALNRVLEALDIPMLHLVVLAGAAEVTPDLAKDVIASLLRYGTLIVVRPEPTIDREQAVDHA